MLQVRTSCVLLLVYQNCMCEESILCYIRTYQVVCIVTCKYTKCSLPPPHTQSYTLPVNTVNSTVESLYETSATEPEIYWEPSTQEEEIYAQMAQWGYQEIPRASVTLSNKLGEGEFGEVYKAELKVSKERSLDVAVKLVKKGAPAEERTKLLQEAATLGQFKHRHVVRLIGVVTIEEPVSLSPVVHTYVCT